MFRLPGAGGGFFMKILSLLLLLLLGGGSLSSGVGIGKGEDLLLNSAKDCPVFCLILCDRRLNLCPIRVGAGLDLGASGIETVLLLLLLLLLLGGRSFRCSGVGIDKGEVGEEGGDGLVSVVFVVFGDEATVTGDGTIFLSFSFSLLDHSLASINVHTVTFVNSWT